MGLPRHHNNYIMEPKIGESVLVNFRLRCDKTQPGQIVKVTGPNKGLGDWVPAKGLALKTSKDEFPLWSASAVLKVGNQDSLRSRQPEGVLEYKYVIVREIDG